MSFGKLEQIEYCERYDIGSGFRKIKAKEKKVEETILHEGLQLSGIIGSGGNY